ncbi:hypothetical protein CFC21_097143 [Triticum aestivum]|uniref:Uncharacterized protein n=3 Tax=Triticum TaxID=4564 RepID=A0A9R1LTM9_WHEAT|nr:hypothetical protein CFC21_097139 [Triticum aestivum]KAF7094867.1 hypothetical protein CFC21_097143 [Triticum aestivum]VAI72946.1 unnamed protein product [Triticum turgidum subsp. durum]
MEDDHAQDKTCQEAAFGDSNPAFPSTAVSVRVASAQSAAVEEAPLDPLPDKTAQGLPSVLEELQLATTERIDKPSADLVDPGPSIQEAGAGFERANVTAPHACMQEALHGGNDIDAGAITVQRREDNLSVKEIAALGNIKAFCAGLLKKLAPPLLKEFEGLRGVKPGHDPFTPCCTTRYVCASSSRKTKASAAETVLLRTLSLDCDDLAVSEDALSQLRTVFDSPLQAVAEVGDGQGGPWPTLRYGNSLYSTVA